MQTTTQEPEPKAPDSPLWPKIDQTVKDQLYYAQMGLGQEGSTDGWQLFVEDGQMRLYTRELVIDGLVCDPLKAVHIIKGVTGYEMCHKFFSPVTRFDWEHTLESMRVVDIINEETLVFHQIHKRIWPAAQRDAVFWSHIRKVDDATPSCLSSDDLSPLTRPDIKLHNVWMVCNNSIDKPEIPLGNCVRVRLTVSLVCETYIPASSDPENVKREDITCKIIYSSTINPGGWAPAAILRSVYMREYPKFLDSFSNFVITSTKSKPIVF